MTRVDLQMELSKIKLNEREKVLQTMSYCKSYIIITVSVKWYTDMVVLSTEKLRKMNRAELNLYVDRIPRSLINKFRNWCR